MKTAVEWFVEQLPIRILNQYHKEIEQAKAMEKEQTVNFANGFYDDCVTEGGSLNQSAEQYYNQTYEKK
jgi:hypothetical protein